MESLEVNKLVLQLRTEIRKLNIQVRNLTSDNKKLANKNEKLSKENSDLKEFRAKAKQIYGKEIDWSKRQLSTAIKTINSMVDQHELDQKEYELNKRKLIQLELRFNQDKKQICELERKCK